MESCILLPSLLAHDEQQMHDRITACQDIVSTVHIDIADGVFVPNTSWADPKKLAQWAGSLRFELHLMVEDPQKELQKWTSCKAVSRFIVHPESQRASAAELVALAREHHWEPGVGMRLDSNPAAHTAFIETLSPANILCMGIQRIGFSGQSMSIEALEDLVLSLHDTYEQAEGWRWIIDGGVREKDLRRLWRMGFSDFVMASVLFDAPDPRTKTQELHDLITQLPEPDYDWVYAQRDSGKEFGNYGSDHD